MCLNSFKGKNSLTFQVYFEADLRGVVNLKGLLCFSFHISNSISKFHVQSTIMIAQAAANRMINRSGGGLFLMNMQVFGTITFPCGEK